MNIKECMLIYITNILQIKYITNVNLKYASTNCFQIMSK